MNIIRVWDEARSSHFELLRDMTPGTFVYRTKNYSFDEEGARLVGAIRAGTLRTAAMILTGGWDRVELNEPTMLKLWPRLGLYLIAAKMRPLLRKPRLLVVLYAIDNVDIVRCASARTGLPAILIRSVMRVLLRGFDRIAFGTTGAATAYGGIASPAARAETVVIPQLPRACNCGVPEKTPDSVLFVSALEDRKGVPQLLQAWDAAASQLHAPHLTIVGKGPLTDHVRVWAGVRDNVTFVHDPERTEIHRLLRSHKVVVLLSQPTLCWREQVGLPIVEGLAHGCEVVCSSESGIAETLVRMGHHVLAPSAGSEQVASAIARAAASARSAHHIQAGLPGEHGRSTADQWLMR